MAKIQKLRRISSQDFSPDDRPFVDKLGYVLNPFLESIVNALTKQLNFSDNFNVSELSVNITAPVVQTNKIKLLTGLNVPCRSILILHVQNNTNNNTLLTSAPFIEFNNISNNQIEIKNVLGLVPGNSYTIKILALP